MSYVSFKSSCVFPVITPIISTISPAAFEYSIHLPRPKYCGHHNTFCCVNLMLTNYGLNRLAVVPKMFLIVCTIDKCAQTTQLEQSRILKTQVQALVDNKKIKSNFDTRVYFLHIISR